MGSCVLEQRLLLQDDDFTLANDWFCRYSSHSHEKETFLLHCSPLELSFDPFNILYISLLYIILLYYRLNHINYFRISILILGNELKKKTTGSIVEQLIILGGEGGFPY